jgi:hypothetical protein
MEINGLKVEIGDFVIIACDNHLYYGWVAGTGVGNSTLQFYTVPVVNATAKSYEDWKLNLDTTTYLGRRFSKGFTVKSLYKTYINTVGNWRVMVVKEPDLLFADEEKNEAYIKAKETLIKLNFLKS